MGQESISLIQFGAGASHHRRTHARVPEAFVGSDQRASWRTGGRLDKAEGAEAVERVEAREALAVSTAPSTM
jgi:hypothetical protein